MYAHEFELTKEPNKSSSDFWKIVKNMRCNQHQCASCIIPLRDCLCLLTGYRHRSDSTNQVRTAPPQFAWLQVPISHLPPPGVCRGPLRPWCDLRVGQWICTNKCNVKSPADRRANKSGWPQQCTTLSWCLFVSFWGACYPKPKQRSSECHVASSQCRVAWSGYGTKQHHLFTQDWAKRIAVDAWVP